MICSTAKSQDTSYQNLDRLSKQYEVDQNWNALIEMESTLKLMENSYWMLVRLGKAFYYTKHYFKADLYLKKAADLNPYDESARYYLKWNHLYLSEFLDAKLIHNTLSEDNQETGLFPWKKPLESIGFLNGVKLSNSKSIATNQFFSSLYFKHRLNEKWQIKQQFTSAFQQVNWGKYSQFQYFIEGNRALKNSWTIFGNTHFLFSSLTSDYLQKYRYPTTLQQNYYQIDEYKLYHSSKGKQFGWWTSFGLNKRVLNHYFEFQIGYYQENTTYPDSIKLDYESTIYTENGQVFDSYFERTEFDPSADDRKQVNLLLKWNWAPSIFHEKLSLGVTAHFISSSEAINLYPQFSLSYLYGENWNFNFNYLQKEKQVLSQFRGSILLNNSDAIQNQFSITASRSISKKLGLSITYQHENAVNSFEAFPLEYHSIYLGLTFDL